MATPRLGTLSPPIDSAEVPPFLNVLLSLASSTPEKLTCVVLPQIGDTSQVLATLFALQRFRTHFDEAIAAYARTEFREGDVVRVNPNNFVYEYAGSVSYTHLTLPTNREV